MLSTHSRFPARVALLAAASGSVAGSFFAPISAPAALGVSANAAIGAAVDARAYLDAPDPGLDATLAQQVLELRERGLAQGLSAEDLPDELLAERIVELDRAISLAETSQSETN